MSKPAMAGAMALALSSALAGCAATQNASSLSNPTDGFIAEVQTLALTACAFVPTADTIAKIWLAESAASTGVETLANLTAQTACQSYASLVSPKSMKHRKAQKPAANGAVDYGSASINGKPVEIVGRVK